MAEPLPNIRTTYNYRGFPVHDGRRNGFEVANDQGVLYEVLPLPGVTQSSGWSFASIIPAFLTRAKAEADAEGGSSARITGRAGHQRSSDGGQKSVYDSEHPHSKSPIDANGHCSPDLHDLHQYPGHKEASVSEYDGKLRKEIEELEDRNKVLEKVYHSARSRENHLEKSRVEDLKRELHQQQALASVHKEATVNEFEVRLRIAPHTPENVVDASTSMNSPSPASANFLSLDAPIGRTVNREATLRSQPISMSQRLTKSLRSLFPFHSVEEAPKAEAVIKRCRETVNTLAEFWSGAHSENFLNRHQCDFLISRMKAADSTLAAIHQFPIFGESTVPVLQELHLYLLDANRLVGRSYITDTNYEWLGAALELSDSKYTFSHLVYDIQWCTSLLQCILLEYSKESHVEFDPHLCNWQLKASDELELLIAVKEDEEELKVHLRATMKELDVSKLEGNIASNLLAKLEACSRDLILINPNDLDLEGHEVGRGAFGVVRKSNFLDRECVVKTLEHFSPTSIEKELESIQKLGNHPHIVRHFCYSKTDPEDEVYLVMELLEMDLEKLLRLRRNQPFSLLEAVSLMLQIGEGMKYMHGKGVAHRDLKPGNVLINSEKVKGYSRIISVKIADFGSAKAAERTETNTMNTGTTRYMAPEVMKARGDPEKARLNLLKADVYSFAMMCIHILTGKYPFELSNQEIKERLKAGERPILRYELPKCPLTLATLLTRCWNQIPNERPPFPSICTELRYIKGLILKGDEQKLQRHIPGTGPPNLLGSVKLGGPYNNSPKDANGHYSPDLDDLHQYPIHREASVNDYEVRHRIEIERLEDRNEDLEKRFVAKAKEYHVEKIRGEDLQQKLHQQQARTDALETDNRLSREGLTLEKARADALEKDNRQSREGLRLEKVRADALEIEINKLKSELAGLRQVKARADAYEKEISKYKSDLAGLQQQATVRGDAFEREISKCRSELADFQQQAKARGDAFEKEINEYKSELAGLDRERTRAAALEKENKEKLEGLSVQKERADKLEREKIELEAELQVLQSNLQNHANALAAKELEVSELKNHQSSWKDILTRENQALTSWKTEQQRKMAQDTSTAGQLRTKVADLTYSKGQMEKREQQLTNQVEEQTKRIEDLKQQNAVLMVKMGALEAQVRSLSDRLQNERQKNADLEELKKKEKPKAAQVLTDDREAALKAQCSALEEQVQSKEILLRESTSKLLERLRQCDLEIDDLKQHIQYLETRDSQELLSAPINGDSFPDDGANPYLLDRAVQRVHEVAGIFSRLLMKAMEQGKIDGMAVARNTFVCSISSGKGAPLKYVLEAITCKLLFQGFEHECFDLQDSTSGYLDMEQQRIDNFNQYKYLSSIAQPEEVLLAEDSLFTLFCRLKLGNLSAVIPEIQSMVQEIISRTFERSLSASEDTSTDVATYLASKLGSTFVKLAVCVWQVHKLAFAFNSMARIFRVSQSEEFVEKYMTAVDFQESESEDEDMPRVDISRVDFMVAPGFLINCNIVIPSRVFVVTKPPSSPFARNGDTQHL